MRSKIFRLATIGVRRRRRVFCVAIAVVVAAFGQTHFALAHEGEPLAPHDLWRAWNWDLLILVSLALAGWSYAHGVRSLWQRAGTGRGVSGWRVAAFSGGLLALFVALISPLDALSGALFSAHMVQHLLLMMVAAPLLVLGAPPVVLGWVLPQRWRSGAARWWHRRELLQTSWQVLTQPLAVWILYMAALWIWHLPVLYEAALRSEFIHFLEHACFLGTAVLFWSSLARCSLRGRLSYGAGILYVFTTALHGGLLGSLLTFTPRLWYPIYAASTPAWGLIPLEDQQLAGVIMWVPMGLVYTIAALTLLGIWLQVMERKERRLRQLLTLIIVAGALVLLPACGEQAMLTRPRQMPGGDPQQGWQALRDYGCHSCHTIPGVPDADATVGPPLNDWANRHYIAGRLPNTPENLLLFVQFPQTVSPGIAMPDMGVTEQDARDIGAYLYTLRRTAWSEFWR